MVEKLKTILVDLRSITGLEWVLKLLEDSAGVPDEARFAALLLVLSLIGGTAWDVIVLQHAFDPIKFGTGGAALGAGIGGWMGWRGKN